MRFAPGSRIGAYEIVGSLGAGGMGEVYRARDAKLKRDVALKILPEPFTSDPERLARFQREAEVLASLNHPNIAHIHGLDDTGSVPALVMELVEGEDLAERLARGPLPLDEALPMARQIADALEAAHEQGIIHRDLKPANIKVRTDGQVKVLDFGLAKALESGVASVASGSGGVSALLANSPTITSPALTMQGMLLGTAAYMSPEQAKGRPADKRSDIWAFGCVLYEMLTGRRAFDGEDVTDTLAAIVRGEPEWRALRAETPAAIHRVLHRCLARDRSQRLADIRDVRLELDEASREAAAPAAGAPAARRAGMAGVASLAGTIAASIAITSLVWWWNRPVPARALVSRFIYTLPDTDRFTSVNYPSVALSRDGTRMVYVATGRFYLKELSDLTARPIGGVEGRAGVPMGHPVFSPDGQWIAFYSAPNTLVPGAIRKVPIGGGVPITLAENVRFNGMSWDDSGILYAQRDAGIMRVAAEGGTPELLVAIEKGEVAQTPRMLPGGKGVLFAVAPDVSAAINPDMWDKADIVVQAPGSRERTRVVQGGHDARYLSSGHLVFARGGTLLAVNFDLDRLVVVGGAVPVITGVSTVTGATAGQAAVSDSGALAYIEGFLGVGGRYEVTFIDRRGVVEPLKLPETASYVFPRLSPDGKQIALGTDDGKEARLWIYDVTGTNAARQFALGGNSRYPLWASDGTSIAFQHERDGVRSIFRQRADGKALAEQLTTAAPKSAHLPESWSPDGRYVLFNVIAGESNELWVLDVAERTTKRLLEKTAAFPFSATFSPDGRWFAYGWREVGNTPAAGSEIFVEPFPRTGEIHRIANGLRPLWSRDGKELFFGRPGQSFVVPISTTPSLTFGNPTELPIPRSPPFGIPEREYDATADGQRFVFSEPAGRFTSTSQQIHVVLNWIEEVKNRVPIP